MPGIAGIVTNRPASECEPRVRAMVQCMTHGAFYRSGTFSCPEMDVYTGWVAHENSFAAGQVFLNESSDIALVFTGECYIDRNPLAELRRRHNVGARPGGWLVHAYEEQGDDFFGNLNGLFSGLLIDKRQRKAFLFNDRYGFERIYWHEGDGEYYFASEAKALLRIVPELREFDDEGVAQFLTYGCTMDWRTLFKGIQLLPAASVRSFEKGKCYKRKYFSPKTWEAQPVLPEDRFESEFQDTFKKVLPRYFESESTIGISLTAGLDCRMIMACLSQGGKRSVCYTFAGLKQNTLDSLFAAQVAKACGLEHQILRLGADFFLNFASHTDQTVYISDGCAGPSAAHEIYLNKKARELAPVRVTGVFGGELLRGVSMFKPLRLQPLLVNSKLRPSLTFLAQASRDVQHPVTFTAFREIPEKRFGIPALSRSQVTFRTPYLDNEIVALAYRAPQRLRGTLFPAWSMIERNNQVLSRISTDMGAVGKANALGMAARRMFSTAVCKLDYLYAEGLPHWLSSFDHLFDMVDSQVSLFGRHKFLHYRKWFRRELAEYVSSMLDKVRSRRSRFWNPDFLETLLHEHINGRRNYVREIDALFTLEVVERLLFRDLPRGINAQPSPPQLVLEPAATRD